MPEWLSASDAPRRMDGDVCDSGGWWRRHQALACFGSRVTAVLRGHAILPKEDPDAAARVCASLEVSRSRKSKLCDVVSVSNRFRIKVTSK